MKVTKKHYQELGSNGGKKTLKKYGRKHFSRIGKLGALKTNAKKAH